MVFPNSINMDIFGGVILQEEKKNNKVHNICLSFNSKTLNTLKEYNFFPPDPFPEIIFCIYLYHQKQ